MQAHPDRLVFIDETSVKTNLTRLRGRSLCGKRLEMTAPFGAWGTQTFIAGLTHDSLIAPWVIKGAMNGEAFAAYIRQVLAPELLPGTVVICDNLATHRNKDAAQALKDVGCWILYLPPYSPDLNPIEMAFSKLKAHLRRIGARTFDQMFDALAEVCNLFTPQECWNYFVDACCKIWFFAKFVVSNAKSASSMPPLAADKLDEMFVRLFTVWFNRLDTAPNSDR